MRTVAEVVLGAESDAVPRARRLARDALVGVGPDRRADAELVVSELVTNAALHGRPPITVRLAADADVVRVEVGDLGRDLPIRLQQHAATMTGRGLALVAALASRWGVEPGPEGGKVVWAELGGTSGRCDAGEAPEIDVDALMAAWADEAPEVPTVTVRLDAVPTGLLVAAKAHVDSMVRELTLVREGAAAAGESLAPELAALVRAVTVDFREARTQIKRQASAAAERGDQVTDLVLELPVTAADAAGRYLAALEQADRYARTARLLAIAPPQSHRVFRRWYVGAVEDQLRAVARGETPVPPQPFPAVLGAEVDRLARLEETSERLALLQEVTAELAGARSAEEMAAIVVDRATRVMGVEAARVYLVTGEGTLRSVAWNDPRHDEVDEFAEVSLDSALPGAEAARTRRPLFLRSLDQIHRSYPQLRDFYRSERSLHVVPLLVGDLTLGVLSVTFLGGEVADETQLAFVSSLGDTVAQAMARAQLSVSEGDVRQTLSFLADATEIMVSAREPVEVVEHLARLAVPRLGDWCTVYLADGDVLRRVAMVIDGFPDLPPELVRTPLPVDAAVPQARAFRTGRIEQMDAGVGRLLASVYPDLDLGALGGEPGGGSGLAVPLWLRGERIGVLALCFLGSGRRVTPGVVDAVTGLAARAAIALDNASRWRAQHEVVRALVDALLPARPPAIPGLAVAARYLPAAGDVAGDWWEAELLPDGAALLGVGDAAGHGIDAVSLMCELRHGARALAVVERSPAALLTDLNRRLSGPDAGFATAVYGRLEPATGELWWANAGQVPPIVARAGGIAEVLGGADGAPLGSPAVTVATDRRLDLAPGDCLVLYSDGVVERRHRDLAVGIEELAVTVADHAAAGVEAVADAVVANHCVEPVDDCCLLVVQRPAAAG